MATETEENTGEETSPEVSDNTVEPAADAAADEVAETLEAADPAEASADDPAEAAASDDAAPKRKRKTGRRRSGGTKGDGESAGARLAAAKAAKAARKAAKRGRDQSRSPEETLEAIQGSELGQRATAAGNWASENRNLVLGLVAAVVLGLGGYLGYQTYAQSQNANAADLLADAIEVSGAEIADGEDATSSEVPDEDAPPTFASAEDRAEAAIEAYDAVLTGYPSSPAASWARLGKARALLDLGRTDDARSAYEEAARSSVDEAAVTQALEGLALTYEIDEDYDGALERLRELSRTDGGAFRPLADYHTARMYLAQGETTQATETLRELVESLRAAEADEEAQEFPYVLAQAEQRLRALDPTAAPAMPSLNQLRNRAAAGPPPGVVPSGGDMTPEQLQQLIQQAQQAQQGGGGE